MQRIAPVSDNGPDGRLLDAIGEAVVAVDHDYNVVAWNRAAEQLFGWSAAQVLGCPVRGHVTLDLTRAALEAIEIELLTGGTWRGGITMRGRDRTPFPAHVIFSPRLDADGSVSGFVAMVIDLSAHNQAQQDLVDREATLSAALEASSALVIILGQDGELRYASPAARRRFGYEQAAIEGSMGFDFIHPDDVANATDAFLRCLDEPGSKVELELRARDVHGEYRWVADVTTNMLHDPAVKGLVINLWDIHDQRTLTQQLATRESVLRARFVQSDVPQAVLSLDMRLLDVNEALCRLLGATADELINKPLWPMRADSDSGAGDAMLADVASGRREAGSYERHLRRADGQTVIVLINVSVIRDERGEPTNVAGFVQDITALRDAEHELVRQSLFDELTGLPNRHQLATLTDRELARSEKPGSSTAVLFMDIDEFGAVNDALGHAAGDALLRQVAERVGAAVRPHDVVGRFGGDELVVLCERTTCVEARQLAEEITTALSSCPVLIGDARVYVSVSVGIACTPSDSADDLLRRGDAAMHMAKAQGRGGVHVAESSRRQPPPIGLTADLCEAIDSDALELHYQPIVDIESGAVLGVEALARWTHPQHGPIGPDVFVALAEQHGLCDRLDEWVLRRGCADGVRMLEAGALAADGYVSINISGQHLGDLGVVEVVRDALGALPAQALVLEVTETALVRDFETTGEVLRQLRALGVRIAIDDFGTGYSSLAYVRELDVDRLKIDQGFVAALDGGAGSAVVSAILGLAGQLGLDVVAEGVETEAQQEALVGLGCHAAQGFLWSRAVPLAQILEAPPEACAAVSLVPTQRRARTVAA